MWTSFFDAVVTGPADPDSASLGIFAAERVVRGWYLVARRILTTKNFWIWFYPLIHYEDSEDGR